MRVVHIEIKGSGLWVFNTNVPSSDVFLCSSILQPFKIWFLVYCLLPCKSAPEEKTILFSSLQVCTRRENDLVFFLTSLHQQRKRSCLLPCKSAPAEKTILFSSLQVCTSRENDIVFFLASLHQQRKRSCFLPCKSAPAEKTILFSSLQVCTSRENNLVFFLTSLH